MNSFIPKSSCQQQIRELLSLTGQNAITDEQRTTQAPLQHLNHSQNATAAASMTADR
jgi:hypothetical protein